jgi:hypothetical protein
MESTIGIIALLIGFTAGWLLRGRRADVQRDPPDEGLAYKLQQRDEELRAARAEIAVHTSTLDALRNEYAILTKRLEGRGNHPQARRAGAKTRRATSKSKAAPPKTQARGRGKG